VNGATDYGEAEENIMSMTKVPFRRGGLAAATRAPTVGPPPRMAIISALCLALYALPIAGAKAQRGMHGGDFHGRDFGHFSAGDMRVWRGGGWRHDWHDGRFGWWWVVGGGWYFYPEPIWPYPTYVPPAIVMQQPPPVVAGVPPAQFWYFCDNPRGYYPNVATCSVPWRAVPVTSPQ
jgi:hypothetical protein